MAASSSYQTLSRYNDFSYRRSTIGNTAAIREKRREEYTSERLGHRVTWHWNQRKLIYDCDQESLDVMDGCRGFEGDEYSTADPASYEHCSWEDCNPWGTPPPSSVAPISVRSDSTSPSTISVVSSDYSSIHSDGFRLTSPTSTPSPLMIQSRTKPLTRKQLLQSRKRINAAYYDPDQVQHEFEQYIYGLKQLGNNRQQISDYINSGVSIISNTISCPVEEISNQALHLLITLVQHDILDIQSVYYILQQGVLFSLKAALGRHNGNQLTKVLHFFALIVKQEPRSVAFITQLLCSVQIFTMIDDVLSFGTREEIFGSFELYGYLFQATQECLSKPDQKPILPENQGSCDTSWYSPVTTLKRLLRVETLELFGQRYLQRVDYVEQDMLRFSMSTIISSLYLTYLQLQLPQKDIEFANVIIDCLTKMELEKSIQKIIDDESTSKSTNVILDELRVFHQNYTQMLGVFIRSRSSSASQSEEQ